MNWKTTSLEDLPLLQGCALKNAFFANNYGAVNSILYEKKFHSQIAVEEGWLFEKFTYGGEICFAFPHFLRESQQDGLLTGKEEVEAAVKELLRSEARLESASGKSLVFDNILSEEKEILLRLFPSARSIQRPESGDYVYRTQDLASLAGKKLSRKRNHIHQFQNKYADFSFETLNCDNLSYAQEIEEKWLLEAGKRGGKESASSNLADDFLSDLQAEREIIISALKNFADFEKEAGMGGGVLFVEKKPAAFCISSLLSERVTDVHFEKCLSPYARDGGYAVINNDFSKTVKTEFINREEDLGLEGLRKAKLSYYPAMVLEKWRVEV